MLLLRYEFALICRDKLTQTTDALKPDHKQQSQEHINKKISVKSSAGCSPYTIPLALGLLRPPRRTATRTIV